MSQNEGRSYLPISKMNSSIFAATGFRFPVLWPTMDKQQLLLCNKIGICIQKSATNLSHGSSWEQVSYFCEYSATRTEIIHLSSTSSWSKEKEVRQKPLADVWQTKHLSKSRWRNWSTILLWCRCRSRWHVKLSSILLQTAGKVNYILGI